MPQPIEISPEFKDKILAGRKAVDAYREAHAQLHSKPWYKGIPKEHTPLLNNLLVELKKQGFNSLERFFRVSEELNIADSGVMTRKVRKDREDLLLVTSSPDPNVGSFVKSQNIEVKVVDGHWGKEAELFINDRLAMFTNPKMHLAMETAVEQCPNNARVFIAGLGLGLVLIYLAKSGKATEVIVYEIDEALINSFGEAYRTKLAELYPSFNFSIIKGDAVLGVSEHGLFDWIFLSTMSTLSIENNFTKAAKSALETEGVYSIFKSRLGWQ